MFEAIACNQDGSGNSNSRKNHTRQAGHPTPKRTNKKSASPAKRTPKRTKKISASSAKPMAKRTRTRKHRSYVATLEPVDDVSLSTQFEPGAPPRQLRDRNAPIPMRKARIGKKNWKGKLGPTTGIFLRAADGRTLDLKAIDEQQPCCGRKTCKRWCCDPSGWARLSADEQRLYIRQLRAHARTIYSKGRQLCFDNYLVSLMTHVPTKRTTRTMRKRRPKISLEEGYRRSGCSWCNTVTGAFNRSHLFRPFAEKTGSGCPRYNDGQQWMKQNCRRNGQVTFKIPSHIVDGKTAGNVVSRPFFCSVFGVSGHGTCIGKCMRAAITNQPGILLSASGHQENRYRHSDDIRNKYEQILDDACSDVLDHYVKHDQVRDWRTFRNGQTVRSTWWTFCCENDPDFVAQCKRLGFRPGYDEKKFEPPPSDYETDVAGRKLKPSISYSWALKFCRQRKIRVGTLATDVW